MRATGITDGKASQRQDIMALEGVGEVAEQPHKKTNTLPFRPFGIVFLHRRNNSLSHIECQCGNV